MLSLRRVEITEFSSADFYWTEVNQRTRCKFDPFKYSLSNIPRKYVRRLAALQNFHIIQHIGNAYSGCTLGCELIDCVFNIEN